MQPRFILIDEIKIQMEQLHKGEDMSCKICKKINVVRRQLDRHGDVTLTTIQKMYAKF